MLLSVFEIFGPVGGSLLRYLNFGFKLSKLTLTALLNATPNLTTSRVSDPLLTRTSGRDHPVSFTTGPRLYDNRIIDGKRVYIVSLPTGRHPDRQLTVVDSLHASPRVLSHALAAVQMVRVRPGPTGLTCSIFISSEALPGRFGPSNFSHPLLFIDIHGSKTMTVSASCNGCPSRFSPRRRTGHLLGIRRNDVRRLVGTLVRAEP